MAVIYVATAVSFGTGREGHVETVDGRVSLDLAYPKELGGSGAGSNPVGCSDGPSAREVSVPWVKETTGRRPAAPMGMAASPLAVVGRPAGSTVRYTSR